MLKNPLFWILVCLSPVFGLINQQQSQDDLFKAAKDFPEILHLVNEAYVDDVNMAKLMPGAFQQAVESLDPNASYLGPGEIAESFEEKLYQRTGLTLSKRLGYAHVVAVTPGSPAMEAGLQQGQILRQIDGESTYNQSLHTVRRLLAGKQGLVRLSVTSEDESLNSAELELTLGSVTEPGMDQAIYDDGIALVSLPAFSPDFDVQLARLLSANRRDNQRVVLDLRHNARGTDADMQRLAALFLPRGELGQWLAAKGKTLVIANAARGRFNDVGLYLLVDESTSRGAEVFAALAQAKNIPVVGRKTLGLPSQYRFFPLHSGGHIHLSTRSLQRNGKVLSKQPVEPDMVLKKGILGEAFLAEALEKVRASQLKKAS